MYIFFFFQAEDGIRDYKVTGVQTCALPIFGRPNARICGAKLRIVSGIQRSAPSRRSVRDCGVGSPALTNAAASSGPIRVLVPVLSKVWTIRSAAARHSGSASQADRKSFQHGS